MTDPRGVRRPNPADLLELDEVAVMCNDARLVVRAWIAAAKDRASVWGLPPCPPARTTPSRPFTARGGDTPGPHSPI